MIVSIPEHPHVRAQWYESNLQGTHSPDDYLEAAANFVPDPKSIVCMDMVMVRPNAHTYAARWLAAPAAGTSLHTSRF